jgi:c-di-GMP-binding flagellar brake protein YcgR
MPANRSRTHRWRDCLWQIYERGGALEIAVSRDGEPEPGGADLIWRVKLLRLSDREIVVSQPAAFGQTIPLAVGTCLVGAMSIGQNRWMFETRVLEASGGERLSLEMPEEVSRCSRRSYYRASTVGVDLPEVECWPLLDPTTVVAAEVANEAHARDAARHAAEPTGAEPQAPTLLPMVGPGFRARLVNISGGGLGLTVAPEESSGLDRVRHLWLRVNLGHGLPAPVALTGRVVHSHIDSMQQTHLGVAFEFGFNPGHRDFVISQVCGVVSRLLDRQGRSEAA